MKLQKNFYNRSTLRVARELLGKFLVHRISSRKIIGKIVETEAYIGFKDLASHASRGKTKRTAIMFGPPGFAYVYLVYGMYYCLNFVTEREHYPAAVLIRAVEPVASRRGLGTSSTPIRPSGPGKVCQYFRIDKSLNGESVCGSRLWLEDRGEKVKPGRIIRAKRVGVEYAGQYRNKKWRFYIKNNIFVSKK